MSPRPLVPMILGAMAVGPAHADRLLTLREAYRIASKRNPDLSIAEEEHKAADALVRQAWALLLPTAQGGGTYVFRDDSTTFDLGPPQGTTAAFTVVPRSSLGAGITVRQRLFDMPSFLQVSRAEHHQKLTALELENTRHRALLDTARAFWAVVTARRILMVSERIADVADESLKVARVRLDSESGMRIDVARADMAVQEARRQISHARAALADAREALGLVLGLDAPVDAVEPKRPEVAPGTAGVDVDRRPDIQAAVLREEIAKQEVRAAWWMLAPKVDAAWELNWIEDAGDLGRERQWQALVSLVVPLYDGGLRYGIAREREARRAQARARVDRLLREAANEVRRAERAVEAQRIAVETTRQQVKLARKTLELARTAYRVGTSTNLEVIQAQQGLRNAEVALAISTAEWQLAIVHLIVATGDTPAG